MLRFTCGERKICSTIRKSQNIMNKIVVRKGDLAVMKTCSAKIIGVIDSRFDPNL